MKVCKVRPDHSICSQCLDISDMSDVIPDCKACKLNTDTYELLQIGAGIMQWFKKMEKLQKWHCAVFMT